MLIARVIHTPDAIDLDLDPARDYVLSHLPANAFLNWIFMDFLVHTRYHLLSFELCRRVLVQSPYLLVTCDLSHDQTEWRYPCRKHCKAQ